MPAAPMLGTLRLVDIGVAAVAGAARVVERPSLLPPAPDAHKYKRGLLAVVGGAMPGAAVLAGTAAQRAGAGYVKLFVDKPVAAAPDLVVDTGKLSAVLTDDRNTAILVGPGLGRDGAARETAGDGAGGRRSRSDRRRCPAAARRAPSRRARRAACRHPA